MALWRCKYGTERLYIQADRWFDVREVARRMFGIPTHEGLTVTQTNRAPGGLDAVIVWEGSAMNNTLTMVVK